MATKELHPTIKQFKEFVKKNPKLVQEVRNEKATWQELYEEWYLLGEDDSRWDPYREGATEKAKTTTQENKGDWVAKVMTAVKNMDSDQIQGQIHHLSQAIAAIQGVLSQFQGNQPTNTPKNDGPPHPFSFRKD
ncbi:YlbD family protein [Bacillus sp. B15-48]|uniref:YlbD family protein n=1 Tax=Bacillus sp. B15-48 TaxID=1548601 RepID=UPI00193FE607|nr:YlbD family protein [Bacillus sp. B15-48]MBM4764055.1 hypothetical protein [Bacillus sp. B15-48]